MKIRQIVLMAIRGNTELRAKIKKALNISEPTLYRIITTGSDDLTKASALKVIREELGLTDQQIMEEETENV